jgi:hypothetical protein
MLIEAALLPRNLLKEGNQIHNFILYLWELLWFNFITVPVAELYVINCGSGSAKAKSCFTGTGFWIVFYEIPTDSPFLRFSLECLKQNTLEWERSIVITFYQKHYPVPGTTL